MKDIIISMTIGIIIGHVGSVLIEKWKERRLSKRMLILLEKELKENLALVRWYIFKLEESLKDAVEIHSVWKNGEVKDLLAIKNKYSQNVALKFWGFQTLAYQQVKTTGYLTQIHEKNFYRISEIYRIIMSLFMFKEGFINLREWSQEDKKFIGESLKSLEELLRDVISEWKLPYSSFKNILNLFFQRIILKKTFTLMSKNRNYK